MLTIYELKLNDTQLSALLYFLQKQAETTEMRVYILKYFVQCSIQADKFHQGLVQ